ERVGVFRDPRVHDRTGRLPGLSLQGVRRPRPELARGRTPAHAPLRPHGAPGVHGRDRGRPDQRGARPMTVGLILTIVLIVFLVLLLCETPIAFVLAGSG